MRRVLFLFAVCLLVLGWRTPAVAQSTPSVEVGKAFKVAFDHPGGTAVSGYRLYLCAGTVSDCTMRIGADIPASALTAGTVTVDVAAVASRGPFTVQASAFNADQELKGPALTATAKLAAPPAPGQPRIIIIGSIDATGQPAWDWRIVTDEDAAQLLALAR